VIERKKLEARRANIEEKLKYARALSVVGFILILLNFLVPELDMFADAMFILVTAATFGLGLVLTLIYSMRLDEVTNIIKEDNQEQSDLDDK